MIRKSLIVGSIALFVVSQFGCNWFSAKPTASVEKPKPASNQQVEKPTQVDVIE